MFVIGRGFVGSGIAYGGGVGHYVFFIGYVYVPVAVCAKRSGDSFFGHCTGRTVCRIFYFDRKSVNTPGRFLFRLLRIYSAEVELNNMPINND